MNEIPHVATMQNDNLKFRMIFNLIQKSRSTTLGTCDGHIMLFSIALGGNTFLCLIFVKREHSTF